MDDRARESATSRRTDGAGWAEAALVAVVLAVASWLRHRAFWTGFDLAIFDQAAWQLAHGRTQISIVDRHVMADHLSPVLIMFGGLYRLVPSPAWLLAGQAVTVGATVVGIRRMAYFLGSSRALGGFLSLASAPLLAAALFDFHPSTLAVPFVTWTIVYALEGRRAAAVATAVMVALCRADLALVIAGAAIVGSRRTRSALLAVAAVAAAAAAVVPGLFGATNGWAPHFGHLGDSPFLAALQPWRALEHLLTSGSLWALTVWVLAAGCLVVGQPRWMTGLVLAGLPVLLSSWPGTELPWYHYGAPMAPLAIGGTLAAVGSDQAAGTILRRLVVIGPVLALAVASPLSPAAPTQNQIWSMASGNDVAALGDLVAQVPHGAAVSADQWLLPHLSHREDLLLFPMPFAEPEGFFAPGSAPPLDQYEDDAVSVVIAPTAWRSVVPETFVIITERGRWILSLARPVKP